MAQAARRIKKLSLELFSGETFDLTPAERGQWQMNDTKPGAFVFSGWDGEMIHTLHLSAMQNGTCDAIIVTMWCDSPMKVCRLQMKPASREEVAANHVICDSRIVDLLNYLMSEGSDYSQDIVRLRKRFPEWQIS